MKNMSHIAGWILSGLGLFSLVLSAVFKFMMSPQIVSGFEAWHYPLWAIPVFGIVSVGSVVLYIWKKTRGLGLLLATGYYGGAWAVAWSYMGLTQSLGCPISLALLWTGAFLLDKKHFLN
ncbi:MAG TPA: DoxX family protein [Acidobacteriota bacterium]|nr:DoxX family protein [Acidobacteriota bacterium]